MKNFSPQERAFWVKAAPGIMALIERETQRKFYRMFPDEDTAQRDGEIMYAREKYPRQMEFFAAGRDFSERCFMAANRVGKSIAGAYEVACHLTGQYPDWWEGKVFRRPVRFWAAGKTNETTRDIVQYTLLGNVKSDGKRRFFDGSGMIPGATLGPTGWKQGVPDLADVVKVKHVSGRWSKLGMKSYQQGRGSFEGTAQDGIWLDEECPEDVYNECLIRTATTKGIVLLTFTPLEGMTSTVQAFLPEEMRPVEMEDGPTGLNVA